MGTNTEKTYHLELAKEQIVLAFKQGELKGVTYKKICTQLIEAPLLKYLAKKTKGNQSKSALELMINRATFKAMLNRTGLLSLFVKA